jgi:ATP-dependent DNA helicase RecQ
VAGGRVQVLAVANGFEQQAIGVVTELQRLAALAPDWNWNRAAVIARNKAELAPVQNYCELHGIPVQSAADDPGSFWRYREVQALVEELRNPNRKLIDAAVLRELIAGRDSGPYWAALREAVEEYGVDTGEQEQPLGHFLEWLVDWCRNVRQRHSGLLLSTAHRAKGLEFDHVAVLDGDWLRTNKGEDPDAPRRLYYVAMTRARQSVLLARMDHGGHMLASIEPGPEFVQRQAQPIDSIPAELYRVRKRLTPADVDLDFAGRNEPGHRIHWRIEKLRPGDPIELRQREDKWELRDRKGELVGRMASAFELAADMKCLEARVAAVLRRFVDDSQPDFRGRVRSSAWEVVIPELVLEPKDILERTQARTQSADSRELDERAVADQ